MTMKSKRTLDIGCGRRPRGTHNIDFRDLENIPNFTQMDLNNFEKFPYESNYFDEVYAYDLLEHVKDPDKVISEAIRVLKQDGKFIFRVPNVLGANAFNDKTHIHYFDHTLVKQLGDHYFDEIKISGDTKWYYPKNIISRIITKIISWFVVLVYRNFIVECTKPRNNITRSGLFDNWTHE